MIKIHEREFFSKSLAVISPTIPRRRSRFAVWLQVASAVFAGPGLIWETAKWGPLGGASSFIHSVILATTTTTPIRKTGCAISFLSSRYIGTAANCPRNRCFLSLFPRPLGEAGSLVFIPPRLILSPTISPTASAAPRTDRNLVRRVGELSVTNYVSRRLHSARSRDGLLVAALSSAISLSQEL